MGYGTRDAIRDIRDDLEYGIDAGLDMVGFRTSRRKRKSTKRRKMARSSHRKRNSRKSSNAGRRIFYAKKTGQPYIKLANGRAKFIKGKRKK